jgi:hypothetical protein
MLSDPVQLFPWIVMVLVLSTQSPDLPDGSNAFASNGRQVHEEKARSSDGIVAGLLDNGEGELRLMNDSKLAGQIQHPGVHTDQTIPRFEMVQRQQKLPIVHLPEPQIDVTDGHQLCLWDAKPESVDNGVGKVLVESEADHASGSPG